MHLQPTMQCANWKSGPGSERIFSVIEVYASFKFNTRLIHFQSCMTSNSLRMYLKDYICKVCLFWLSVDTRMMFRLKITYLSTNLETTWVQKVHPISRHGLKADDHTVRGTIVLFNFMMLSLSARIQMDNVCSTLDLNKRHNELKGRINFNFHFIWEIVETTIKNILKIVEFDSISNYYNSTESLFFFNLLCPARGHME